MKKIFYLNKKTFLWTIIIFVCVVFAGLAIWTFDFYPVAFVNYHPIMAYEYYKSVEVAQKYYGNAINMSDAGNLKTLQQAVLQGLIDEVAIDKRLRRDMSASEVQSKIDSESKTLISDQNVLDGLSQRGISAGEAEKYFFPIAAKNDILTGQLMLENKELISWLVGARKDLKVMILLPRVHWISNEVRFD